MAIFKISDIIKNRMHSMGLTQRRVAENIIDKGHFSRILNDEVTPNYTTIKLVFERIGLDASVIVDFYLDSEAIEHEKLKDELETKLRLEKFDEAKALMKRLESNEEFIKNMVNKQHLLTSKAGLLIRNDEPSRAIYPILEEAIKMFIPAFEEKNIEKYLLTKCDIKIINMIAILYHNDNKIEKAIDLMKRLKANFDRQYVDPKHKGSHYPLIMYNLSKYLGMAGHTNEAIKICDEGIDVCIETRIMSMLPSIAYNKAVSLLKLGDDASAATLYTQAYHSALLQKEFRFAKHVKDNAQDELGIIL